MRDDFGDERFWDKKLSDEESALDTSQPYQDRHMLFERPSETRGSGSSSSVLQVLRARLGLRSPYHSNGKSMDLLLFDLTSREWTTRVEAVRALEALGKQAPAEALLAALKDESSFVRAAAARAIGELGDAAYKTALVLASRDREWNVRASVIQALGNLGEQAPIGILVMALEDEDASVRAEAVWALGKQGERVSLELLLLALKDEDASVRAAAIGTLAELDASVPIAPIALLLKDEDESVRAEAAWALEKLNKRAPGQVPVEFLLYALKDEDASVRATAAWALAELGERAPVKPLVQALYDEDEFVRMAAASALQGRLSPETIASVLENENGAVHGIASESAKKPDEQAATELLLSNLGNFLKGKKGRVYPAFLGMLDPRTLVLKCWYEDKKSSAGEALSGTLRTGIPVEPLVAAFSDTDEIVRGVASQVLEELGKQPWTECFVVSLDRSRDMDKPIDMASPDRIILCGIGYDLRAGSDISHPRITEHSFGEDEHSLFTQLMAEWIATSKESLCEHLRKLTGLKVWYTSFSKSIPLWSRGDQGDRDRHRSLHLL